MDATIQITGPQLKTLAKLIDEHQQYTCVIEGETSDPVDGRFILVRLGSQYFSINAAGEVFAVRFEPLSGSAS